MLPFYDDACISKRQKAFRNYVASHEVETIDKKSLDHSLDLSKKSIYSLFDGLLREKKCFKCILTTVVTLKKNELIRMKVFIKQCILIQK